jgi:hypothetical protein
VACRAREISTQLFRARKTRHPRKTAFVHNYTLLFGAKLRAAILAQDPANVFENWQGLMVGEGRYNVWVRDTGDGGASRYQIVAINGS